MTTTSSSLSNPFFNLSINTDALSSLFSGINDRFEKLEQRAKLYEDRSLQMLDALTEATQRLTVSENQYAAVFDTVTTLQKSVTELSKDKLDKEDHHKTIGRIDDQLGQLRMQIEVVDSRKQEVDIPALMKRVMQEARDNAAKMLIERETEQRRYVESLVHDKTKIIAEDVNKKTDIAIKTAEATAQNAKKDLEETSHALSKRIDTGDQKIHSTFSAIEHICTKLLMSEINVDALSDLVKEDVGEARQLVSCVCHAFNVNLDTLVNAISKGEKHSMLSESTSEGNVLRGWKWDRLELLRKQSVVDSWGPIKNVSSQEFTKKLVLPNNYPPVPDANVALTKRDEMVRAAANRRREMLLAKQQGSANNNHNNSTQEGGNDEKTKNNNNSQQQQQQVVIPESGKLFLASPVLADVETRAVDALRSDMSVLQQKISADSLTQIQQLDKVVRSKISFDRAQALVNEAAGVAAEKCIIPVRENIESVRKAMLTRENALALLSEKVSRSEVMNLVQPAIEESAKTTKTADELYTDAAVTAVKNNLEKQVAGVRDRCAEIDRNVNENSYAIEKVSGDVHAIQLKAAGSIEHNGSGGEKSERCLSCGTDLSNNDASTNHRRQQHVRTGSPSRRQHQQQQQQQQQSSMRTPASQNISLSATPQGTPLPVMPNNNIQEQDTTSVVDPVVSAAINSSSNSGARVVTSCVDDISDRNLNNNNENNQNSGRTDPHQPSKTGIIPPLTSSNKEKAGSNNNNNRVTTPTPPLSQNSTNINNNNNVANGRSGTTAAPHRPHSSLGSTSSKQQQQQQQVPANNWYQHMDEAFQARSLGSSQQQPASTTNETNNNNNNNNNTSRPTSARNRPGGAWSSMKKN